MKLLITMGLADRSVEHHIKPITVIKSVDEIIIVRDNQGPILDKVVYVTPPKWVTKSPILKTIFKFALLLRVALRGDVDIINGYLLFPYGIMSYLVGIITRKPKGVSLIAGPVELYLPFGGSPVGEYPYSQPLPKITGLNRILLHIIRKMDYITVTGCFTKEFLIKNKVHEDRIFVVPHIVDDRFMPNSTEKIYDVVYVGRLAKVKHVETFIRAINNAKKTLPHIRAAIVGDGPEMEALKMLSNELGLHENIHFVGYKLDVWNWYNKAKISILTSEREGFPYSVVEALSCGVPVITSNCGDVTDVVRDGYNGIIIKDYNNHELFADAIVKLLTDPKMLNEYSNNSHATSIQTDITLVSDIWYGILSRAGVLK